MTEPAWILQARELFGLLSKQAKQNKTGQLVFEGNIRKLYNVTGASSSNYTRIMRLLKELGVIRYVQKGNRHQTSIIEITGELGPGELLPPEHLTSERHAATLVAEIEPQVKSLQAWRESLEKGGMNVAEVLRNFELRITRLERELVKYGKGKTSKSKSNARNTKHKQQRKDTQNGS